MRSTSQGEHSMDHRLTAARLAGALASLAFIAACSDHPTAPSSARATSASASFDAGGVPNQEALDHAVIYPTVETVAKLHASGRPGGTSNLSYHGGIGGIGVEATPRVYVVVWGSQWNNNDPSGEVSRYQSMLSAVFGSSWLNSVTQYCQGVASGTITCGSSGTHAGNANGQFVGTWVDNAAAAPSQPTQSQLAAEAVAAAAHFGNTT